MIANGNPSLPSGASGPLSPRRAVAFFHNRSMKRQPTKESIAARLREARESSGKTQTEIADALGTTKGLVSQYECGRREPGAVLLWRLAKALRVSVDELVR